MVLPRCGPSCSARPWSTSSASAPSRRSARPTRSSRTSAAPSPTSRSRRARGGAQVALAGGAGDDAWGAWLRERLAAEGVDLDVVRPRPPACVTPVAFVTVDAARRALVRDLRRHDRGGDRRARGSPRRGGRRVRRAVPHLEHARRRARAGADARRPRPRARAQGKPVLVDPNLRLHRWPRAGAGRDRGARAASRAPSWSSATREEARLLSGEDDPRPRPRACSRPAPSTRSSPAAPHGAVAARRRD